MNAEDLKNNATFQRAVRPWLKKHKSLFSLAIKNDFKRLRLPNGTLGIILDSGDKPESIVVCTDEKHVRCIIVNAAGHVLKTSETYATRRKGLNNFIKEIGKIEWDKGVFKTRPCLYASPVLSFIDVYLASGHDQNKLNDVLKDAYDRANTEYHNSSNGESFLTDAEFDDLENYLRQNRIFTVKTVGAKPDASTGRVHKLPNVMPSLEYEKTPDKIAAWAKKKKLTGLVYSPKIDGISLQLIYDNSGALKQAFVRGDGFEAEDKTYIALAIPDIPKQLKKPQRLECRVEAYMDEDTYFKKYSPQSGTKYKFKSARACVSGMFNRKIPEQDILKDVKIYGFEAFKGIEAKTKTEMLNKMSLLGIPVVPLMFIETKNLDQLTGKLTAARKRSPVAMDGLVLEPDTLTHRDRIGTETNSINPAWATAFKPSSDGVLAEVVRVEWNVSPHGYLKPVVYVKEMSEDTKNKLGVNINGVTVKKLTAFNAAYIRDNNIGPGTILRITRQGDAIPYIKEVVKSTRASFPDKSVVGEYEWNDTKVDLVLKSTESSEHKIQQIIRFFNAVGMEYFSEGTIRRLYTQGFTDVPSILKMDEKAWATIPGFKDKSIGRVRKELVKLKNPGLDLPTYMYASGAFGRGLGKDKLTKIYEEFGDDCLYGWDGQTLRDIASSIETIHGFSFETGTQFAKGIKPFLKFAQETKGLIYTKKPKTAIGNRMAGTVAYLTGFRNQDIADFILEQGGKVGSGMNNATNLLLVKNRAYSNDKTIRAAKTGVKVMTEDEFKTQYMTGV